MPEFIPGPGYTDTTYPDKWTDDPFFAGLKSANKQRERQGRRQESMTEHEWAKYWEGIQQTGMDAAKSMSRQQRERVHAERRQKIGKKEGKRK